MVQERRNVTRKMREKQKKKKKIGKKASSNRFSKSCHLVSDESVRWKSSKKIGYLVLGIKTGKKSASFYSFFDKAGQSSFFPSVAPPSTNQS